MNDTAGNNFTAAVGGKHQRITLTSTHGASEGGTRSTDHQSSSMDVTKPEVKVDHSASDLTFGK